MGSLFSGTSLIADTDSWILWALIIAITAVSVFLSQRYKWASKLSAPVLCIIFAVILTNLNIMPQKSAVYSNITTYCIPLATSMMLFKANLRTIFKDTGKMFLCINVAAVAVVIAAVVSFFLMKGVIPEADKVVAGFVGSFIGGGTNRVAIATSTGMSETMQASTAFVNNFAMTLSIIALLWMPTSAFFKKRFPHPYQAEVEAKLAAGENNTVASASGSKNLTLLDLCKTAATAFVMVAVAMKFCAFFKRVLAAPEGASALQELPALVMGNSYVMLTLMSVILVYFFPKFFESLKGANEIGTFLIYLYFVTIGCPMNVSEAIRTVPLLFVFAILICAIQLGITLLVGKLTKQTIEESTVALNAAIGGPFTACAMVVSKGYEKLVTPSILCGIWGNTIATIVGLVLFAFLKTLA